MMFDTSDSNLIDLVRSYDSEESASFSRTN